MTPECHLSCAPVPKTVSEAKIVPEATHMDKVAHKPNMCSILLTEPVLAFGELMLQTWAVNVAVAGLVFVPA